MISEFRPSNQHSPKFPKISRLSIGNVNDIACASARIESASCLGESSLRSSICSKPGRFQIVGNARMSSGVSGVVRSLAMANVSARSRNMCRSRASVGVSPNAPQGHIQLVDATIWSTSNWTVWESCLMTIFDWEDQLP